jgi:small subunit ribosomal protein S9
MEMINAVGRRKAAVARVYIKQGTGNITINGREYTTFFALPELQVKVTSPLKEANVQGIYDVQVNVMGGGTTGQAEAIRLGIARALCEINSEFRPALKAQKYLTRDPRVVERKKYGKRKARRSTQFSKR